MGSLVARAYRHDVYMYMVVLTLRKCYTREWTLMEPKQSLYATMLEHKNGSKG